MTTTVSFQSDQNLASTTVWVTPSLDGILLATPGSFASIVANQTYQLTFTLSAPPAFQKRSFGGTIHIRNADDPSQTYAPPLTANLQTDYATYSNSAVPLSFSYPVFPTVPSTIDVNSAGLISFNVTEGSGADTLVLPAFSIQIVNTTSSSSLVEWFARNIDCSFTLSAGPTKVATQPAIL